MIRVLLMCMFIASSTHDIHFTKSTIDYNNDTQTLQVVINVFTDDLELSVERTHENLDLEIGAQNQHALTNSLVGDYVQNKITFTHGPHDVKFTFIGFEYDYDICYLYLESETFVADTMKESEISMNMFYEVYDDQENVVDLNLLNTKESTILTKKNASYRFQTTP